MHIIEMQKNRLCVSCHRHFIVDIDLSAEDKMVIKLIEEKYRWVGDSQWRRVAVFRKGKLPKTFLCKSIEKCSHCNVCDASLFVILNAFQDPNIILKIYQCPFNLFFFKKNGIAKQGLHVIVYEHTVSSSLGSLHALRKRSESVAMLRRMVEPMNNYWHLSLGDEMKNYVLFLQRKPCLSPAFTKPRRRVKLTEGKSPHLHVFKTGRIAEHKDFISMMLNF